MRGDNTILERRQNKPDKLTKKGDDTNQKSDHTKQRRFVLLLLLVCFVTCGVLCRHVGASHPCMLRMDAASVKDLLILT